MMTVEWQKQPEPIGYSEDTDEPTRARLLGTLLIAGVPHHAEFIEVRFDSASEMHEPVQEHSTGWASLIAEADCASVQTVSIDGREYAVIVTPFED